MPEYLKNLESAGRAGFKSGWRYFLWTCKIIIPISLVMTVVQWLGWLNQLDFLLNPLMDLINLPSQAALPLLTGMLINLYPVVAIISVVPFTTEQMTLIAVFNLIAHNLLMEGAIQYKSGFSGLKGAVVRIVAAIAAVLIISSFLGDTSQSVVIPASLTSETPLTRVLTDWGLGTALLMLRVFGLVMVIMIMQEYVKLMGWIDYIERPFRHFMAVMGLSRRTTLIWIIANVFGLFYGGAAILEEVKKGTLPDSELEDLHISIGVNHSMIEDPALFVVIGLPPFWLWVPRFVMAIATVQLYRLVKVIKSSVGVSRGFS